MILGRSMNSTARWCESAVSAYTTLTTSTWPIRAQPPKYFQSVLRKTREYCDGKRRCAYRSPEQLRSRLGVWGDAGACAPLGLVPGAETTDPPLPQPARKSDASPATAKPRGLTTAIRPPCRFCQSDALPALLVALRRTRSAVTWLQPRQGMIGRRRRCRRRSSRWLRGWAAAPGPGSGLRTWGGEPPKRRSCGQPPRDGWPSQDHRHELRSDRTPRPVRR